MFNIKEKIVQKLTGKTIEEINAKPAFNSVIPINHPNRQLIVAAFRQLPKDTIMGLVSKLSLDQLEEYRKFKQYDKDSILKLMLDSKTTAMVNFFNKARAEYNSMKSKKSIKKITDEELDNLFQEALTNKNYIKVACLSYLYWRRSSVSVSSSQSEEKNLSLSEK